MPFAPPIVRLHVVLRGSGFEADGLHRERGEVLDTSEWRNVRPLVETRSLAPAPYDVIEAFVQCECGRRWIDEESEAEHKCPARVVVAAEESAPESESESESDLVKAS